MFAYTRNFRRTLARRVKDFDIFPKMDEDHAIHTNTGGSVSLVCAVIIVILFFSELRRYLTVRALRGVFSNQFCGLHPEIVSILNTPFFTNKLIGQDS